MFDDGSTPRDLEATPEVARRARLHAALDAMLDGAADPSRLTGAEAAEALTAWHHLRLATDGAATVITPRWDTAGDWQITGHPSPAHWMINHLAKAKIEAHAHLRTARIAATMRHVTAALTTGRLPSANTHHLVRARTTDVAEAFDRDEAELVEAAAALHADAFRAHLATWHIDALTELGRNGPDPRPGPLTERDRLNITRSFAERRLLDGELCPASSALLTGAIDAEIDTWHRTGQLDTATQRSRAELQADALLAIVRRGAHQGTSNGSPRPSLIAVVDLDTLLGRAHHATDQRLRRRADILGGGPATDADIEQLLCDADLSLVITDPKGEPLWIGRTRRTATTAQRNALLAASNGTCEWPGCTAPHHHTDVHHIVPWSAGGTTDIDNLALLCHRHHAHLHAHGNHLSRGPTGLRITDRSGHPITTPYEARWRPPHGQPDAA